MKIKVCTSLVASLLLISGCTTYHSAAAKGNIEAINRLQSNGSDINKVDGSGTTALIYAVNINQKESVIALLKAGADVNARDMKLGNTPLHHAILQGNVSFVRLFVENGADVTLRNNEGISPFDLVQNGKNEEINRLVKSHNNTIAIDKKIDVKPLNPSVVKNNVSVAQVNNVTVLPQSNIQPISISENEARGIIQRLMAKHETLAIRKFLNEHPETISLISDPRQQLRYVGPAGWRIMDISEGLTRGSLKEKEVIEHIAASGLPYKHFTDDEIRIITHYGISVKIINAMIGVTH
jgi:hypothetical protein